jgi:hypothetical protein
MTRFILSKRGLLSVTILFGALYGGLFALLVHNHTLLVCLLVGYVSGFVTYLYIAFGIVLFQKLTH